MIWTAKKRKKLTKITSFSPVPASKSVWVWLRCVTGPTFLTSLFNLVTMEMCCLGIFPPSQSTQRSLVFVPLSLREKARSQFCLVTSGLVKPRGLCLTQVDSRSLQVNSGSLQRSSFFVFTVCSECEQRGMWGIHLGFNPWLSCVSSTRRRKSALCATR